VCLESSHPAAENARSAPRLRRASVALAIALSACAKKPPPPPPPAPVTVATAHAKTVPIELYAVGLVKALQTVSVTARVTGAIAKVHFREGDAVVEGAPLFTLDRRPLEAALRQARGVLARDLAQSANAMAQARRYAELLRAGVTSLETYRQMQTQYEAFEAVLRADRAAVALARLNLDYAVIRAPLTGRTGQLLVNEGNLVVANDTTPLVVIKQVEPIYVTFAVPQQRLAEVRRLAAKQPLEVTVAPPEHPTSTATGKLDFLDNAIDASTGMITLKAIFDNKDSILWPGQFVGAHLKLETRPNAVLIPTKAVQTGQSGTYVYILKPDKTVELRPVEVGPPIEDDTIVDKGVAAGETVVTDGQLRLHPGAKVHVTDGAATQSAP
jgi:multidrug efflux system membrane fusion protein